ncbi:MAG TPA: hypothetical protein VGX23_10415 [Actinocrinis sp.]|nr:hypothetical protein [Actinocrinis sp.]
MTEFPEAAQPHPGKSGFSEAWKPLTASAALAGAAWTLNHYTEHLTGAWHYVTAAIVIYCGFCAVITFMISILIGFVVQGSEKSMPRWLVQITRALFAPTLVLTLALDFYRLAHHTSVLDRIATGALIACVVLGSITIAFRNRKFRYWQQACYTCTALGIAAGLLDTIARSH